MLYRVVRPFPLSLDGLTLIDLKIGDEREDFGGMEAGLEAEGFIEPAGDKPVGDKPNTQPEVASLVVEPVKHPEARRRRGK